MRPNDATYMELIEKRDRLETKQSELERELEDVRRKHDAVSVTLGMLDDDGEAPTFQPPRLRDLPSATSIDLASLRGMTQIAALRKIAEHGGGQLRTADAKRLFLQAGLIKTPKNANNILFTLINRSPLFERVEPGVYRLIATKPEKPARLLPEAGKNPELY